MPLSSAQIDFINSSIDYLLEFPADKDELTTGIQQFNTWLSTPPEHPDEDNVFYALTRYLRSPESTLQHLEDYGKEATIKDVQKHILTLIVHALELAAGKIDLSLDQLGWNITNARAALSTKRKSTTFKSKKANYEAPTLPWVNVHEAGQTFTYSLSLNSTAKWVILTVIINMPDQQLSIVNKKYVETPDTQFDEYFFMENLAPYAKKRATDIAAIAAYRYLDTKNLLPADYSLDETSVKNHYHLLVESDILALIINQQLSLNTLSTLSDASIKKLKHPVARQLLANHSCTLDTIGQIPLAVLDLLTSYSVLLNNDHVNLKHFITLNDDQQKILQHPVIINLIHQKKLSIDIAIQLPVHILKLLSSPLYADYLLKNNIDWETVRKLSRSHVKILLSPAIANCLKQGIVTLKNVMHSKKKRRKKLRLTTIQHLLENRTVTLQQVDRLSMKKCDVIQSHPLLCECLIKGIITFNDLVLRSRTPLYVTMYSNRLIALFNGQPFIFYSNQTDTAETILTELFTAECHVETETVALISQVVTHLLKAIKERMETSITKIKSVKGKAMYIELCEALDTINRPNVFPFDVLADVINIANRLNTQPRFNLRLFSSHQGNAEFNSLCENLNQLNTLCHFRQPGTITYRTTSEDIFDYS